MGYVGISSQENYININISILHTFDLETAVYWAVLNSILYQVHKKKKYDDSGYFKLDRKYMAEKTGLDAKKQKQIESILESFGIIDIDHTVKTGNKFRVDIRKMLSIIIQDNIQDTLEQEIKIVKSEPKEKPKKVKLTEEEQIKKKEGIVLGLCKYINEPDSDLYNSYKEWITSMVFNKTITKLQIETFQNALNTYTQDKALKLNLLRVAAVNSYKDLEYVLNKYNSLQSISTSSRTLNQKSAKNLTATEVF